MTTLVTIRRVGAAAVLTLNDPDRRNILTSGLVAAIGATLDELEADPDIRAVIVTGNGPAFCAGAELATLEQAAAGDFGLIREVYSGFLRILHSPLLTIGAVNGPAVGAGFNLALACDLRLAAPSARFVCRFADLHIFPGGGHTWMLERAIGLQQATKALLLGQEISATDAVRYGLVTEIVDQDQLVQSALDLCTPLSGQSADYTRRLVAALRQTSGALGHAEFLELEAGHQEWSTRQPEFLEGLARIQASISRRQT